jgi:uncharacterized protein
MQNIPKYEEILELHKKYAPSDATFDLVFTHCQIVWEIAAQLIDTSRLQVNPELVKAGCLLHDIGVYRLFLPDGAIDHANYIKHGYLGYELLKEENFGEGICRFASCHTGVGLSKSDVIQENIPIPPNDYMAQSLEERLVMYADKFHTKSTPPKLMTPEAYCESRKKFGEAKVARFREFQKILGSPDLNPIAKKYNLEII